MTTVRLKPKTKILLLIAAVVFLAFAYKAINFFINYSEAKPIMGLLSLAEEEYFSKDNHKTIADILESERYSAVKKYAVEFPTYGDYLVKVRVNRIFIIAVGKNRQIFWLQKDNDFISQQSSGNAKITVPEK